MEEQIELKRELIVRRSSWEIFSEQTKMTRWKHERKTKKLEEEIRSFKRSLEEKNTENT